MSAQLTLLAATASCLLLSGCQDPAEESGPRPGGKINLPVPEAQDVETVQITVTSENSPEPRCALTLNGAKAIARVVAMLRRFDWTQPGPSLAEIRLKPFEIEIVLTGQSRRQHSYGLYWQGNRLAGHGRLIKADLDSLRQVVIDELILHNCGEPAEAAEPKKKTNQATGAKPAEDGVPREEDITALQIAVSPSNAAMPRCMLTVDDKWSIGNFVALLRKINWSQEGRPLERMQILAPDVELTVFEKDGLRRHYAFYWQEDGFIDGNSRRFLEADVSGFRQLTIYAILARCEARVEQAKGERSMGRFVRARG